MPPPAAKHLAASYDLVARLEPLLVELQGRGRSAGLLSEGPEQRQPQQVRLDGYVPATSFERGAPPSLAGVAGPARAHLRLQRPSASQALAARAVGAGRARFRAARTIAHTTPTTR